MTKILIIADMEGCAGVHNLHDKNKCMKLMCSEMEAMISVLPSSCDAELFYCDCHSDGSFSSAFKNHHKEIKTYSSLWSIDFHENFRYAMFTGFHDSIGGSCYPHAFRTEFSSLTIGDQKSGEVGILSNWLLHYGIQTIFVSGTVNAIREIDNPNCVRCLSNPFAEGSMLLNHYKYYQSKIHEALAILPQSNSAANYNSAKISIDFEKEELREYIIQKSGTPMQFFNYTDTIHFMEELPFLCKIINSKYELDLMISKLRRKIRFNNLEERSFQKLSDILAKDISSIDISELNIIAQRFESLVEGGNI